MKNTLLRAIYRLLGSICLGNGLYMLFAAGSWFRTLPMALGDTGPLNPHFVHDVGLVFVIAGVAAFWCAHKLGASFAVHVGLVAFIGGHASIHAVETLMGLLPSTHWLIDFPLVTLPALLLIGMTPAVRAVQPAEIR